jgi:hypothetical protein
MSTEHRPHPEEVEHLLRNAELRDELEPFLDEAIGRVNVTELPTPVENEFLASMLAWERAPVVPISKWYEPELVLAKPETLSEDELHQVLWNTIYKLFDKRILLDFTDHLSDRELYCIILRDILPCHEKQIDAPSNYLHWDCANVGGDPEVWLRYYATEQERLEWEDELPCPLPQHEDLPHARELPRRPL